MAGHVVPDRRSRPRHLSYGRCDGHFPKAVIRAIPAEIDMPSVVVETGATSAAMSLDDNPRGPAAAPPC
jgi:hypothetical protein